MRRSSVFLRGFLCAFLLLGSSLAAQVTAPGPVMQPLPFPVLLGSAPQVLGLGGQQPAAAPAVTPSPAPVAVTPAPAVSPTAEALAVSPGLPPGAPLQQAVDNTNHAAGHKTAPVAKAPSYLESLALILYSDAVMSVENVLIIAILVSSVPQRIRVVATFFGLLAAGVFRVVFASLATILMKFDVVGLLGSIALLFLTLSIFADTVKQMQKKSEHPPEEKLDFSVIRKELERIFGEPGFWSSKEGEILKTVTTTVILQDILLSLDNVLVVAGNAHGDISLTMIGVALSIVMMATIANFMVKIVQKYPVLGFLGGLALAKAAFNLFHQSYDPEAAVVAFGSIVVFVMFSRVYKRLTTDEEAVKPIEVHLDEELPAGETAASAVAVAASEVQAAMATPAVATAGGQVAQTSGIDSELTRELVQMLRKNGEALSRIEALLSAREAPLREPPGAGD